MSRGSNLLYAHREFLNEDPRSIVAISASVEVHESSHGKFIDAELTLSDCNRIVNLDFGVYSNDDLASTFEKKRQKLDQIIEVLLQMRTAFGNAGDIVKGTLEA